jgi:hypothetical protein
MSRLDIKIGTVSREDPLVVFWRESNLTINYRTFKPE